MKLLNHSGFDLSTRETSRVSKTRSLIVVNHPPAKGSFSMFFLRTYFCSFLRRLSFQIVLNSIVHSNRRGNFSNFQMALGRSPCTKNGYQWVIKKLHNGLIFQTFWSKRKRQIHRGLSKYNVLYFNWITKISLESL
jgi:hypothetical protein